MKRIRILVVILCACFVSAAWGQQQQACKANTPWREFHRYNMERWNPCEHVLNVNNVGNLHRKWSYKTGNVVDSSPAALNGVVYVGSDDDNLYALKASTGALLWSYPTGGYGDSPTVANGVVYVGGGGPGNSDYNVWALNAATGALIWSYATGDWVGTSSPAVVAGVVYVGSYDSSLYAL